MVNKVSFTENQLAAIEQKSGSMIVSAAAGSGKTMVLVERLIRQIYDKKNPLSLRELTMVTFTNDAAAGMRKKLLKALSEKIRDNPKNVRLRQELSLIPVAKIMTINAFCLNLCRENIADLPVSSGFFVLDETRADSILRDCIKSVFEQRYKNRDEEIGFLAEIFCNKKRDSSELAAFVKSLYDKLRSIPFYREFLPCFVSKYRNGLAEDLKNEYEKYIFERIVNAKKDAETAVETAREYGFEKLFDSLSDELDLINAEYERIKTDIPIYENVSKVTFKRRANNTVPKDSELNDDEISAIKFIEKLRSEYKSVFHEEDGFISHILTEKEITDDLSYNADVLEKISKLINEIDDEYAEKKAALNGVDFADTEHFAISILSENVNGEIRPSKIAEQISKTNKTIMIDEFQDSNDVQDLIFRLISQRDADNKPNNLFCVGDVKQSIYSFRAANPKIFMRYVFEAEKCGNPKLVRLTKNFRSSLEVVNFVNAVFTPIMRHDTFNGINYADDALIYGGDYSDERERKTEIIITEIPAAKAVAQRIKQMLEERVEVKIGDLYRPCKPSDFCILMRTKKAFAEFQNALFEVGLKSAKESTDTYLSSLEIQILLNILRVLDNPNQDIPLASVMMSPLFNFSLSELATIRMTNKNTSLYEAVKCYDKEPLSSKILDMTKMLKNLKTYSYTMSADAFIQLVFDSTDLLYSLGYSLGDTARRKANLQLMTEYAKNFSANQIFANISGFIRYIENIIKNGGDFSSSANNVESDDAVKIKTIHKSKGLEFPFVFLCDVSRGINKKDLQKSWIYNSSYGVGVRYQNRDEFKRFKTFPQIVITELQKKELFAESVRLLYVALTRAKERLFIAVDSEDLGEVLQPKNAANKAPSAALIHSCKSFSNLLAVALSTTADGAVFRGENPPENPLLFTTTVVSFENETEKQLNEAYKPVEDENLKKNLLSMWSEVYPYEETDQAAKLTVSEIALNSDITKVYSVSDISLHFDIAVSETPKLSASEKGTAMHRFMQKCEYKSACRDIHVEIERLRSQGMLSDHDIGGLNRKKLVAFFDSRVYKNVIDAMPSERIRREFKIYAKLSDIRLDERIKKEYNISDNSFLQGVADLVIERDNDILLLDYKTNANFFREKDGVSSKEYFTKHMKDLYSLQLNVYAAAISAIFGKPVSKKLIYSFAISDTIEIL
ncbi:MAG: UvrD-helicase domain-containing protein [Ruminococcus sp.]|jgi:ATP-dependent helicase/nuclease subunit A|nr:UvrD-helicase domain-containing protein [Ruminococcus sp.]